jgi:hypothetical protein
MTLRRALLGLGVLALLAGLLLVARGAFALGGVQLILLGAVLLLGVLLEAGRYRARARPGRWERTAERFVDPTTGRTMEVLYDRETGERQYVEVGPDPPQKA